MARGPDDATIWSSPLPAGVDFTRTLWVNGKRCNRTTVHSSVRDSADNDGYFHPTSAIFTMDGTTVALTNITKDGYVANSSSVLQLRNPADIELLYTRVGSAWTEGRCSLEAIIPHPAGAEMLVKQPCFANQRNKTQGQDVSYPRSLEQLSSRHLLQPGDWFLDRASALVVYMPTAADLERGPAESSGSVLSITGVDSATLLDFDGVTDLTLDGIHFDLAGAWGGAGTALGFTETQAGYHATGPNFNGNNDSAYVAIPAAVHVHGGSRGVTFNSCNFTRMGATALMFSGGTQACSVVNSSFSDLSGSAVMLGQVDDWAETDRSKQNGGFLVAHNTITRTSVEYRGSPGIAAGYVLDTTIEHNEVSHLSYSGISLGWGWGQEDSYARNNTIRYNLVHHHMCGPLFDGGSVYTLGPQGTAEQPSTVHGNYFHDQCNLYGCLYFDDGSGFFHAWDNVIDKCEQKIWLLINGNSYPNSPQQPKHFTYQGSIRVSSTFVGPPNKEGDAPEVNYCKSNCTVTGTVFMESGDVASWPAAAKAVVANAGPRAGH